MKALAALCILTLAGVAAAQPIVWENFDQCSGNWMESATVGAKNSFQPSQFRNTQPVSEEGGCYLAYTSADTFHAGSVVGWFGQQKPQSWTKRWVNMMVYSRDSGVALTLDLSDDADGDTLTNDDVDLFESTPHVLSAGWQEVNFDLDNDFTDINPGVGNDTRDPVIRAVTFNISTAQNYTANDTIHLRVDQIQNSDTTGFAFLSVVPDSFAPDLMLGTSRNLSVQLLNTGTAPMKIRDAALDGPGAARYIVVALPDSLFPGRADQIVLQYAPTVAGEDDATYTFGTDAVDNPVVTITLQGRGDTAVAQSDKFWIFPGSSIAVGNTLSEYAVVRNTGRVPLTMMDFDSIGGPGTKDYSVASSFHGTIAPGATDSLLVHFTPSLPGNRPASLRLYYKKTATIIDSIFVPMMGVGGIASINTDPLQVYDSVTLGQSADYVIRMTGYASYGVQMRRQTMEGTNAGLFTLVKPLTAPLMPGVEDSVIVRFIPTSLGVKSAYLQLLTDAPNWPLVIVPLTIVVGTRTLAVAPGSAFETDTALVGSTISRSILCMSTGTLPVRIDSVRLLMRDTTHSYTITRFPASPLAAGASDTLTVHFQPTVMGVKVDTIRFYCNSPSAPVVNLALRGFAGARNIFTADTTLIDTVTIEQVKVDCFIVRDSGNLPIVVTDVVIGGTDADQFLLVKPSAFPHTILPGHDDTICVRISPTSPGDKQAQLIIQSDAQNKSSFAINLRTFGTTVRVQDPWQQPFSGVVYAAPNPMRDVATLHVALAPGEHIARAGLFDVLGRQVRDLGRASLQGEITMNADNLPAGLYYVRIVTSSRTESTPITINR